MPTRYEKLDLLLKYMNAANNFTKIIDEAEDVGISDGFEYTREEIEELGETRDELIGASARLIEEINEDDRKGRGDYGGPDSPVCCDCHGPEDAEEWEFEIEWDEDDEPEEEENIDFCMQRAWDKFRRAEIFDTALTNAFKKVGLL